MKQAVRNFCHPNRTKHPSVGREPGRDVRSGLVCKATQRLYYVPQKTPFDQAPFDEAAPVAKFQSNFYSYPVEAMFKALGIERAN